jgi:hypothetical protein
MVGWALEPPDDEDLPPHAATELEGVTAGD